MSEFTREEKEKIVESERFCMHNVSCEHCPLGDDSCNKKNELLISLYEKHEKEEPAPAEADTSSKENIVYKDDSTALKICQGALLKIEKCSSDGWTRGYCTAVREMFEAQKEETNV